MPPAKRVDMRIHPLCVSLCARPVGHTFKARLHADDRLCV